MRLAGKRMRDAGRTIVEEEPSLEAGSLGGSGGILNSIESHDRLQRRNLQK